MPAGSDKRPVIKLKSTAGTGYTYVTNKNKVNTRDSNFFSAGWHET